MAHAPRPRHVATSVLVEPGSHATPGSVATLRVHARNVTTSPLDLIVAVVGLESGWLPAPVPVADVAPDATVTVELPLLPPVGELQVGADRRFEVGDDALEDDLRPAGLVTFGEAFVGLVRHRVTVGR